MIHTEETAYGLSVRFAEELTREDFKQFERALLSRARTIHRPDVLMDLSVLQDFTLDMAWEQLRFVWAHEQSFGRIAIVVQDKWIKLGAHLANLLTAQHPKYFKDLASATIWLSEEAIENPEIK